MNREILVSAVLRAESRREGAIDIDIVRRALAAQPAPVPVAWLKTMYSGTRPMLEVDYLRKDTSMPVYTHSAAPVPVPLTDEQIDKILERERMRWAKSPPTYEFAFAFARAIERAHGIAASPEKKP
jgi:hypothetical protein